VTRRRLELLLAAAVALYLAAVTCACVRAVQRGPVAQPAAPWCVWIRFEAGDASRHCFETRSRCEWAETGGRRYGSLGFVAKVDDCAYSAEGAE
jgi:hypothetical protein